MTNEKNRNNAPFSGAVWITPDRTGAAAPVIEKRFTASGVIAASLTVTGLGWFCAECGGRPVTEDRFVPTASDYEPRDFAVITYPFHDRLTHRIYYCAYDVTPLIRDGENLLTVQLGGGWYRQKERLAEGEMSYSDELKTIFRLTLLRRDGSVSEVLSDGSETWRGSVIRESELFLGETIDAGYSDPAPKPVRVVRAPEALLTRQDGTPDRLIRTLSPRLLSDDGLRRVYDCGETVSGVVRVTASGAPGQKIVLRFSDVLGPDGQPDPGPTGSGYRCASGRLQIMEDTFLCSGGRDVFEPRFVWHAFRYFEIEGPACTPEALVIHSDTPVTSTFDSDSEGLNFLYDAFLRTQLDNMHGSFPSDCPHRERLGYTGDGQAAAPAAMLTLDCRAFYRKWIRDILDCQDAVGGHIQHTAPFQGGGGGPGGWGGAVVLVPWAFYRQYGDVSLLTECYPAMKKWIGYMRSHSEDGLVVREEEGGWCLGDWCAPVQEQLPEPFVNTCFLVRCLRLLVRIAQLTGTEDDIPAYEQLAEEARGALIRAYHDEATGHFCGGTRGADAYAADIGIEPARAAAFAAERSDRLGAFDTGFLGTDILTDVLFSNGYADTAYRLLGSEKSGSFLYMKRSGATTIWERWTGGGASRCHPMFGGCCRQLFTAVLGIRQTDDGAGFRHVVISPSVPSDPSVLPTRASGSIVTPSGRICSAWERIGGAVRFRITIPEGCRAEFRFGGVFRSLDAGENVLDVPV